MVSRRADPLLLLLYDDAGATLPARTIPIAEEGYRRGDLREILVEGVGPGQHYAWAFDPAQPLLDPNALACSGPPRFGEREPPNSPLAEVNRDARFKSIVIAPPEPAHFERPRTPLSKSVFYELHVRGFTRDPDCEIDARGTYAGLVERIPYLRDLGVTAVELLPVHEFDETEIRRAPGLVNFWGYSPISWMALQRRYAEDSARPEGPLEEFRSMVQAFHRAGIEVLVDVVFNHTGELDAGGPTWSLRGLDPSLYYLVGEDGRGLDQTGCGNTVRANHPVVIDLVLATLRWWVHGLGVDGFRFDLASILARGDDGELLEAPPLVRAIESDPFLRDVHLVAEPWDAAGGHLVDRWPGNERWSIWNDRYRDAVRGAWFGETGRSGELATRLSGSSDLFGGHAPQRSLNFITAHDGFTLRDLVAYSRKHNDPNGEGNRDGSDHERSDNHGAEGPTRDLSVHLARERSRRNLMATLLLSQGVPMLLAGDEFGRSQRGNNNAYCHDGPLSWVRWADLRDDAAFHRFTRGLIHLRRETGPLRQTRFLEGNGDIHWLSPTGAPVDWDSEPLGHFGYLLAGRPEVLVLLNLLDEGGNFALPEDREWRRVVDTAAAPPDDFSDPATAGAWNEPAYPQMARSLVLFLA